MNLQEPSRTDDADERAGAVRMVLFDADGVFSDGRLFWNESGGEGRAFHARDGMGIRLGQRAGLTFGIVSGRESFAVADRARELSISEVHLGIGNKKERLGEILDRHSLSARECCFIGDDVNDLPVLREVGFAAAPVDAVAEVAETVHFVSTRRGGHGAVREVIDFVLRSTGLWDRAVEPFYR